MGIPRTVSLEQQQLTSREGEVLLLLCDGLTEREIGARLGISQKTVEFYRAGIKKKWGTSKAVLLARRAIRLGIIDA